MIKKLKNKFGATKGSKKIEWKEENQALVALIRAGKTDEAMDAGQKMMDFVDRKFSKDTPEKATTYNNMGMVLMMHGDHGLAEECFREALSMRQKIFGPENREVALVMMNMAQLYKIMAQQILALHHETTETP